VGGGCIVDILPKLTHFTWVSCTHAIECVTNTQGVGVGAANSDTYNRKGDAFIFLARNSFMSKPSVDARYSRANVHFNFGL
jgi:hypothetical protein